MKKVFIVHGYDGSPNGGWRPWLMGELENIDIYACALPMPTPDDPYPNEWVNEISRVIKSNDEVCLVGHSLGVPAVLRFIETYNGAIRGAVLVSGPAFKTDNDKVNRFFENDFDFDAIKTRCKQFVVIHGDNDPLVPLDDAKELKERLAANLYIIKNGGHLNGSSGWKVLPECLTAIKEIMI